MANNDLEKKQWTIGLLLLVIVLAGCGTTKTQTATQQLLISDAVDQSVASIDFQLLAGQKVFLDTKYIPKIKDFGFVNAEYVISSLRQQMIASHCLLQDKREDAQIIVEARVGALGTDAHTITYGVPASHAVSSAATLLAPVPHMPTFPEISLARRNEQTGAAKISVFAYYRISGDPVWQSGIAQARSDARDTWFLGAGPFQRGSIYYGTRFAGGGILGLRKYRPYDPDSLLSKYSTPKEFMDFTPIDEFEEETSNADSEVEFAGHTEDDHEEEEGTDDEEEDDDES